MIIHRNVSLAGNISTLYVSHNKKFIVTPRPNLVKLPWYSTRRYSYDVANGISRNKSEIRRSSPGPDTTTRVRSRDDTLNIKFLCRVALETGRKAISSCSGTHVKYLASILPVAPNAFESFRFSKHTVLCIHRTLASSSRTSSCSGV